MPINFRQLVTPSTAAADPYAEAAQRRKLADALAAQSSKPRDFGTMSTGQATTLGLAQLAEALLARKAGSRATDAENSARRGTIASTEAMANQMMPATEVGGIETSDASRAYNADQGLENPDAFQLESRYASPQTGGALTGGAKSLTDALAGMDPRAANAALMQSRLAQMLPSPSEPFTLGKNEKRFSGSGEVLAEGVVETPEAKDSRTDDIKEWEAAGKPGTLQDWILSQRRAGATKIDLPGTNIQLPNPLIQKWSEKLDTQETGARDAVTQLEVIKNGRALLDKGIISGIGADYRLGFARALNLVGADNDETIANTESYISNMGTQVGSIIKLFGAGTGLSNADREYAEKIVAGKITLNEASMRKVLDINERLARAKIKVYNDQLNRGVGAFPDLGKLYSSIEVADTAAPAAPPEALNYLKSHPEAAEQFKQKYGYLP